MSLDTSKWLNARPIVHEREIPPRGVFRVVGVYKMEHGFVPELDFFPGDTFLDYAERLQWSQEKLDGLINSGGIIPAMVDVSLGKGVYIKSGFFLTEKAEEQRCQMLG